MVTCNGDPAGSHSASTSPRLPPFSPRTRVLPPSIFALLPPGVSMDDIRHALSGREDASGIQPPSQLTAKLAQLPPSQLGVLTAFITSHGR
jgi:hypothetical protein